MTLYVVFQVDDPYVGYGLLVGVFSSEKLAKQCLAEHGDDCYFTEVILDEELVG